MDFGGIHSLFSAVEKRKISCPYRESIAGLSARSPLLCGPISPTPMRKYKEKYKMM
jgi:hypothetical protein